MRKLVLCELFKYRRNKVIPALTSLSLLFPLALIFMTKSDLNGAETLAEYHAYYDSLFNNNLVYSSMLLLPALSGCISAVLFFTERDCGAFKNLRVIPVTERELIFAKLITLYLWSVIYSAGSTAAMTLFCLFLGGLMVWQFLLPDRERSDVENRTLQQVPEFSWEALRDGTLQAIATDHAPHTDEEKAAGAAGMVGLETAFGVCYTKLCKENGLPLARLAELMSTAPAEILGLAGHGRVLPGYAADLALVELDTPYTVDKNALHSKSHNCPYDGVQLFGRVDFTIKGGKITWKR